MVRKKVINGQTGCPSKMEKVTKMTMTPRKTASIVTVLLAGSAMLVASAAMARGPMGGGADFATLDADENGEISASEFEAYKTSMIAAIDTNEDGYITQDELEAMREARKAESDSDRFAKLVERLDTDGDGQISLEEFAAMGGKRGGDDGGIPRGLDADQSGGVSEDEFNDAQERRAERGDRGGHGHDGKGPKNHGEGGAEGDSD